jgi:sugar porter (SP) family MFS transporter
MAAESQPNARMYVAISTAMIGAIMFGIDCGNFGSVQGFASFRETWCNPNYGDATSCGDDAESGAASNSRWLKDFVTPASALLFVGAAAGSLLLGPPIAQSLGRRPCISTGAVICLLGCLMTSYVTLHSEFVFFAGRFVTGFGIGVCTFALPLYNSEVSAPAVRGATGSMFQVNVVVGQLVASVVTYYNNDWRVGMLLPGVAGVAVALGVWLAPESPRYIMAKRGFEEGALVLAKVRAGSVEGEAAEVIEQLESERSEGQVGWLDLVVGSESHPSLRRRVLIACWLQFAQQFTGMNMVIMFSADVFKLMGFENPFGPNIAFTALQVVGIVVGLALLDSKWGGRRVQLALVTATICPLLVLVGLSSQFGWSTHLELALLCLFAFTWQLAWGMIPWVYPSELFTMAERDRATSLAVFVQYAANAALTVVVPQLLDALGFAGMVWFFAAFNALNLVVIAACIRETKGIPLEDVPYLFGAPKGAGAKSACCAGAPQADSTVCV